jgi:low affinity Fe/Cu permease
MKVQFRRFAVLCAACMGTSYAFVIGVVAILLWAATGPYFKFSDTWQLVINTGTTVITFLMVFVIQYTQNRDTQAMQLKLDELVRAVKDARNEMIGVEDRTDDQLIDIKKSFQSIAK